MHKFNKVWIVHLPLLHRRFERYDVMLLPDQFYGLIDWRHFAPHKLSWFSFALESMMAQLLIQWHTQCALYPARLGHFALFLF